MTSLKVHILQLDADLRFEVDFKISTVNIFTFVRFRPKKEEDDN